MDDIELFINRVRAYPALYDKTCSQYHDKIIKENCWAEVVSGLNYSSKLVFLQV